MCMFVGLTDFAKRGVLTLVDEILRYRNYPYYYLFIYLFIYFIIYQCSMISIPIPLHHNPRSSYTLQPFFLHTV